MVCILYIHGCGCEQGWVRPDATILGGASGSVAIAAHTTYNAVLSPAAEVSASPYSTPGKATRFTSGITKGTKANPPTAGQSHCVRHSQLHGTYPSTNCMRHSQLLAAEDIASYSQQET